MNVFWPYVREEVSHAYLDPKEINEHMEKHKYKYALHTMIYTSLTLPKRLELGDAIETNAYHLFIYMLARFYFFDNGGNEIVYYYPNKQNNYLVEKALSLLPSRFKRETQKKEGFEYVEMPGCRWYTYTVGEPWMYSYVRDLYKHIWESIPQVKGKYSYISRNPRECNQRRLWNESELLDPLKRAGFSIYTMEHMTFEDQIRLFRSSEIITGLHGAGMIWLVFCHPGTYFLEIGIVGGKENHREHYEDICIKSNLPYYRYTKTLVPDPATYPDAKDPDCVIDVQGYMDSVRAIVSLKESKPHCS
jgi:hypothetical protein